MIPAVSPAGAATGQPVSTYSATRAAQPQAPETARASSGEAAPAQVKLATSKAVTAPEQTAVAPRLRDQETAERTDRETLAKDTPTGPPPTFEESPLERQARLAFEPPEPEVTPAFDLNPVVATVEDPVDADDQDAPEVMKAEAPQDPPPTPSERAEASFTETKSIAAPKEPATVDVGL